MIAMESKASSTNLRISVKHSIGVSKIVKGLETEKAKEILKKVMDKKLAVPYRRGISGKRGGKAGFPVKAAKEILKVIESAENNAKFFGMEKTRIKTIVVNKGRKILTPKRKPGRALKNAEVVVILSDD